MNKNYSSYTMEWHKKHIKSTYKAHIDIHKLLINKECQKVMY